METGALVLLGLAIVAADLALKRAARLHLVGTAMPLGALGCLKAVPGSLRLLRGSAGMSVLALGSLWALLAASLIVVAAWLPAGRVAICLLLAGSASNLLEHAARGTITDYICLRAWPAFNLADVALTAGAASLVVTSLDLALSMLA